MTDNELHLRSIYDKYELSGLSHKELKELIRAVHELK